MKRQGVINLDNFLTVRDFLTKHKINRRTLSEWQQEGLPYIKIGNNVWFKEKITDEWVQRNK